MSFVVKKSDSKDPKAKGKFLIKKKSKDKPEAKKEDIKNKDVKKNFPWKK